MHQEGCHKPTKSEDCDNVTACLDCPAHSGPLSTIVNWMNMTLHCFVVEVSLRGPSLRHFVRAVAARMGVRPHEGLGLLHGESCEKFARQDGNIRYITVVSRLVGQCKTARLKSHHVDTAKVRLTIYKPASLAPDAGAALMLAF